MNKVAISVLGILAVCLFALPVSRILHQVYIDPNEAWNAYHTTETLSSLYTDDLTPVNYPPFYFYIMKLFPDPLIGGRILSLISLFCISLFISLIVYQTTRKKSPAIFAGILNLAFFLLLAPGYVGMNDPQIFATAIMLGGFYVYLRSHNVFWSALLFIIALFIKNNLIVVPLVVAIDLLKEKRLLGYYLLTLCGGSALLLGLFQLGNPNFIQSLLIKRTYHLEYIWMLLKMGVLPIIVLFVVGVMKKGISRMFILLALLAGLAFSGGAGTDINMYFDLYIALSIALGFIAVEYPVVVTFALINIAIIFGMHYSDKSVFYQYPDEKASIELVRQYADPVFCEENIICYYAGKKYSLDPFLVGQQIKTGAKNPNVLLEQRFTLIQLYQSAETPQNDPAMQAFYDKIKKEYRLIKTLNGKYFYEI